jgi:hypothetical protein
MSSLESLSSGLMPVLLSIAAAIFGFVIAYGLGRIKGPVKKMPI